MNLAQAAPPLPGGAQPGHDRPIPQAPEPQPGYDFRIESPHRSPVPRDVDKIHFKLNGIHIVGAVTLPAEKFEPLYAGLIGKDVTLTNVFDIADGIERLYREAGYPLIRAYVPPQRVNDGIFTINVREGFVAAVAVEGGTPATQARIRDYLGPVLQSKPLKLSVIERGLLLTNDLPGIVATGVLRASPDTPGASDLIVNVTQPRYAGDVAVDNRGSRFTGIWSVSGEVILNSIFDDADQLDGAVTVAPEDNFERVSGAVHYRRPFGEDGAIGSLDGVITNGVPGSTLHAQDVITDSYAVGGHVSYPLLRSREQTLFLSAGLTIEEAKVDVFSTVKLSHDKWRVFDMDASYVQADVLGGPFGVTLDVAQGLNFLGATPDHAPELSRIGGDTHFTKLVGGLRYTHPIFDHLSIALASQAQYSFEPLIAGEQVTFGGDQIGRGYDPGAITGDDGLGGSVELRYEEHTRWQYLPALQPFAFFDTASTWYINHGASFDPSLRNQSINSTGAGVRLWFPYNVTASVEVDQELHAVPGSDGGHKATKVILDAAVRF